MGKWQQPTITKNLGGYFQILVTKPGRGTTDVTFFRGVPTQLSSYTQADPFGDATAVLQFPQITLFDDPDGGDLAPWYGLFSNVDIWWVYGVDPTDYEDIVGNPTPFIDPLTNQRDIIAPGILVHDEGTSFLKAKVWEGFITSIDGNASDSDNGVEMQCQGALFQLDRYMQKPFFPPRPVPLELIINDSFSPSKKPHLRTKALKIQFPVGWSKKVPAHGTTNSYTLDAKVGTNWSGYASRQTGSWDKTLTGYVQDRLTEMIVPKDALVGVGNSWTINHDRETQSTPGRTPVMKVRDRNRAPDFSLWLGTPGVVCSFSRDGTQMANVVYGEGTSIDGTTWRNAVISNNGSRTDFRPLAWDQQIWPYSGNKKFNYAFAAEAYLKFGSGFDQVQATSSANQTLARDSDAFSTY